MPKNIKISFGTWFVIVFLFLLAVSLVMPAMLHIDREAYTVTVTEKTVKRYGDEDKFLVFAKTEDGRAMVLENTDSLIEGKFNSADIQAKLEVGKKYNIRTYGWRIPFFSMYENIVKVRKAD